MMEELSRISDYAVENRDCSRSAVVAFMILRERVNCVSKEKSRACVIGGCSPEMLNLQSWVLIRLVNSHFRLMFLFWLRLRDDALIQFALILFWAQKIADAWPSIEQKLNFGFPRFSFKFSFFSLQSIFWIVKRFHGGNINLRDPNAASWTRRTWVFLLSKPHSCSDTGKWARWQRHWATGRVSLICFLLLNWNCAIRDMKYPRKIFHEAIEVFPISFCIASPSVFRQNLSQSSTRSKQSNIDFLRQRASL